MPQSISTFGVPLRSQGRSRVLQEIPATNLPRAHPTQTLTAGGGQVLKALTYPEPKQRIAYHPASAPLHRIKTDDMLPLRLLTPFQAENDHAIKDTVNYVTVQVGRVKEGLAWGRCVVVHGVPPGVPPHAGLVGAWRGAGTSSENHSVLH